MIIAIIIFMAFSFVLGIHFGYTVSKDYHEKTAGSVYRELIETLPHETQKEILAAGLKIHQNYVKELKRRKNGL